MAAEIVSRHYFRRRARREAERLNREDANYNEYNYFVTKAIRGPYRWYVRRERRV